MFSNRYIFITNERIIFSLIHLNLFPTLTHIELNREKKRQSMFFFGKTIHKTNIKNTDGCIYPTIQNDDIHSIMMIHFTQTSDFFPSRLSNKQTKPKHTHTQHRAQSSDNVQTAFSFLVQKLLFIVSHIIQILFLHTIGASVSVCTLGCSFWC